MKINVGSQNPAKVEAIREILKEYAMFVEAEVNPVNASSDVSEQPKSLDETIKGAINRAKSAFAQGADLGIGIESGLMAVPYTKTGYMDLCACAIYDGRQVHLGLSSAFEFPKEVTRIILEQEVDANEAAYRAGLTKEQKIGSSEGIIGIVTKGRVTRKEYTKQAIRMALIHLENPEIY